MVRKNKKKAPSRIRYEQENPTISCRLDKKTKGALEAHLIGSGCSLPDFIKQHLAEEKNMSQASPAKVKVKGINQIAIVVKDVQKVAENYWNILGIGPWDIYAWEAPLVYNRIYHGKPAWAREKIALAQVGAVQLELCQPVAGNSIYQDFLIEHGEGLHHLNFLVDDVDETAEMRNIIVKYTS